MTRKNILIFPCGSEIGLEINKALSYSPHFELFGASSEISNHGKYVFKNYIEGVPYFNDPDFIEKVNNIIDKYKIDFVIPAHDSVILKLAENVKELKCKLVTSEYETCRICRSKSESYKLFKDIIPTPKVYDKNERPEFPVFLKPDVGQGSKGVFKAKNEEELAFHIKNDDSLLILEYLPGKEFTVDCFTDRKGELLFSRSRERIRVSNGISVNTKPYDNPDIQKIAETINRKLKLRGAWFFQVKQNREEKFALLEIAPRIAGAMGMYRNLGINFTALSIYDHMELDVSVMPNDFEIEMDRALSNKYKTSLDFDHVYMDFDDAILMDGNKVNPVLVYFIYQCLNQKKKITLITKHARDIEKTLSDIKLDKNIFDKIVHLQKEDKKSDHIKDKNAIFIDDSFAERADVHNKTGMATFDHSSIECLLDWKV
jgi:hypothetical protein